MAKKASAQERGFVLSEIDGPRRGEDHFFAERATIGRTDENDLLLVGQGVSRKHARIWVEHDVYLLQDLGSANGSRLNGERVGAEPEVLRDGDYLTFGDVSLQFSLIAAQRGEPTADSQLSGDDVDLAARRKVERGGKKRRPLVLLLVAAVVLGVGAVFWALRPSSGGGTGDRSDEPLTYADDDAFFGQVLGLGDWDSTHPDKVMIDFTYTGGQVTVHYAAAEIDKTGEIAVLLNDEHIGYVPLTMGAWRYGLRLTLPSAKLKKENRLVFDSTLNPPGSDSWQICYLRLTQEVIPPPDEKEARYRFDLAKQQYDDRGVETGNLYRALLGVRQALKHLEGLKVKPDLYREAEALLSTIDGELTQIFQNALFSARRAERVGGGSAEAGAAVQQALRYFADKSDFRYRELARYLEGLNAAP